MDESFTLFSFLSLLFMSSFLSSIPPISAFNSTHLPLCHDDERLALFQFKESFIIDNYASSDDPSAYPKVESWKLNEDCCSWDGVECNHLTGNVIGLDLSSSCLYGSINSRSSLFRLIHLRKLNLAFNNFNYSQIPPVIGLLSKLVSLNVTYSFLSGPIPSNISDLPNLSSLDLSFNYQLSFKPPNFRHLVNNSIHRLKVLSLSYMGIFSAVPAILANASSLSYLDLENCGLYGEFPIEIFHLPKLELLGLGYNEKLRGYLPEFHSTSSLKILSLASTNFSSKIPESIGNLDSLTLLRLSDCTFSGEIPESFGNLTKLSYLYLRNNAFDRQQFSSLSWLAMLTKLMELSFGEANLYGEFPSWFANLTQLSFLSLRLNGLTGPFPTSLINLTDLTNLDLYGNRLQGSIPNSISRLRNLVYLNLQGNSFSGTLEWDIFLELEKLQQIHLSENNLTLLTNTNSNNTFQKFRAIGFGGCKLDVFPDFLRYQDKLEFLDLSGNSIAGQIPKWLMNMSTDSLQVISLASNSLTGFEAQPNSIVLPWVKATTVDLSDNMLQSSPPLPAASIKAYYVADNRLTGEIPSSFCNLTSVYAIGMYNNQLSGRLPSCLGNFSTNMELLNLGNNDFYGKIPLTFSVESNWRMIGLSYNQLQGEVPRSLSNCDMLEFLDIGNNQIRDVFPSWLGQLPNLKILILRSNQFHGVLTGSPTILEFQKLRIINLSRNNFTGRLPAQYFYNWVAMKVVDEDQLSYMSVTKTNGDKYNVSFWYSMFITSKGTEQGYERILDEFVVVDFSCNKFEGEIPGVIGSLSLQGIRQLNLSHNNLSGNIPSILANLTRLESLDLSHNKLSGTIPQQLAQLDSLAVFNVSHNFLIGPIPQGKQFNTFQNDSYQENFRLCGNPLSRKCGNSEAPPRLPPSLEDEDDSNSLLEFGWESVAIGYASGLAFGLVIGCIVVTKHYQWFARFFRVRVKRTRRARNRRAMN